MFLQESIIEITLFQINLFELALFYIEKDLLN